MEVDAADKNGNSCATEHQPQQQQRPFAIKRWNLVATWSWDVECDTCAICRVHLMEACLRCQSEAKAQECVVIWGECNHCFHLCCMSLWVKQNNRCPLCQADWAVQRVGK
uniref:RING-type domain-containing protein n=1 Tax=Globodera pallida TaxID=36090 RepID=A0A183BW14_GLOPA